MSEQEKECSQSFWPFNTVPGDPSPEHVVICSAPEWGQECLHLLPWAAGTPLC